VHLIPPAALSQREFYFDIAFCIRANNADSLPACIYCYFFLWIQKLSEICRRGNKENAMQMQCNKATANSFEFSLWFYTDLEVSRYILGVRGRKCERESSELCRYQLLCVSVPNPTLTLQRYSSEISYNSSLIIDSSRKVYKLHRSGQIPWNPSSTPPPDICAFFIFFFVSQAEQTWRRISISCKVPLCSCTAGESRRKSVIVNVQGCMLHVSVARHNLLNLRGD